MQPEYHVAIAGWSIRTEQADLFPQGRKVGCVLVQLPPGLAYDPRTVETFFTALRAR